ncbi:MAG: hypothetical protein ABIJ16_11890 [Bacteroidota bacterium]
MFFSESCRTDEGCTDPDARNYDSDATEDDGSCYYNPGCTDEAADNYDDIADHDDGSCYYSIGEYAGRVSFFRYGNCGDGKVSVYVDEIFQGELDGYYTEFPACDDTTGYVISYIENYGNYVMRAESDSGTVWEGNIYIPRNRCVQVELWCDGYINGNAYQPDETKGELMVWTGSDFGGTISVQIDGVDEGFVSLIYDSIPYCGAEGCVTKCNLIPGTYLIHAECGQFIWGNYTIQVFGGRCSKFELK